MPSPFLLKNNNQGFGQVDNFQVVKRLQDLPQPDGSGAIQLYDNTLYWITGTLDLLGYSLVGGQNTVLFGSTSEVARIKSTGLSSDRYLFYSAWTTPMQYLTFQDHQKGVRIVGTGNNVALDWTGVNFLNINESVYITDCENFVYDKGALLNSTGMKFDGTIGTVALNNSLFSGTGADACIFDLRGALTITRRFRVIYSSIIAFGSTKALCVDQGNATIPTEGLIFDTINFAGGGTYLDGVDFTDLIVRWIETRGVPATTRLGVMSMAGNSTQTVISAVNTPAKVAGATTAGANNQRFTHTDGRLTYAGGIETSFDIVAAVSLNCPGAPNENISVYIAKNGAVIPESKMSSRTANAGTPECMTAIAEVILTTNDYIEVFCENNSTAEDLLVETMTVKVVQG